MKIGKFSFEEILKFSFDKALVNYTFKWSFIALAISVTVSYFLNIFLNLTANLLVVNIIDFITSLGISVLILGITLGIALQLQSAQKKAKKKPALAKSIKALLGKYIGTIILFLIAIIIAFVALFIISLLGYIPVVGPYIMALFSVPAVIGLTFFVAYLMISGKLLVFALLENPKIGVVDLIKKTILLTTKNIKKIVFYFFLGLLPLFFLVLSFGLILFAAYALYVIFFWFIPQLGNILQLSMQSGTNELSFILLLSGTFIFSYVFAHVMNMNLVILYSIYLDAISKK